MNDCISQVISYNVRPLVYEITSTTANRRRLSSLPARRSRRRSLWRTDQRPGYCSAPCRNPADHRHDSRLQPTRVSERLGVLPSRMVILLDELTEKGLVERRRSTTDRRHSEIVLTSRGRRMLEKLSRLAAEHEADLCAALSAKEREQLAALGRKIVHQQGLTPDVHPGYRKL